MKARRNARGGETTGEKKLQEGRNDRGDRTTDGMTGKDGMLKYCFFLALAGGFTLAACFLAACERPSRKEKETIELLQTRKADYTRKVPGEDEQLSEEIIQKGEVLIAYSDCAICHREDEKARGPAYQDIADRYPANEIYIKMLASKVINGGSGTWGYAVMTPHPGLSAQDAEAMVTYILSLDN